MVDRNSHINAGAQPRGPLPAGSRLPFGCAARVGCSGLVRSARVLFGLADDDDESCEKDSECGNNDPHHLGVLQLLEPTIRQPVDPHNSEGDDGRRGDAGQDQEPAGGPVVLREPTHQ